MIAGLSFIPADKEFEVDIQRFQINIDADGQRSTLFFSRYISVMEWVIGFRSFDNMIPEASITIHRKELPFKVWMPINRLAKYFKQKFKSPTYWSDNPDETFEREVRMKVIYGRDMLRFSFAHSPLAEGNEELLRQISYGAVIVRASGISIKNRENRISTYRGDYEPELLERLNKIIDLNQTIEIKRPPA